MDFSTLLVIDCKTTLWETAKEQPAGQTNDIICLDIALIDTVQNEIIEHEIIYVKPKKSKVSRFCESLFGIPQYKLDADGIAFEEAYRKLRVHYMSRDRFWASWGHYEKYVLDKQCKALELEPLFTTHCQDIKHLYGLMTGTRDESGIMLNDAIKQCDLKLTENSAYNAASIFTRMAKGLRPIIKTRIVVPSSQRNVN